MKKIITIFLTLIMFLSLVGCGEKKTATDEGKTDSSQTENKETKEDATKTDKKASSKTDVKGDMTFTETVLVDNDDFKITITKIDPKNKWGEYVLKGLFENKSKDKTYSFSADEIAINGVQSYSYFYTEVAAGKKSNEEIVIYSEDYGTIGKNDIGDFTDIELNLQVYELDDWGNYLLDERFHIYPYGEDKATTFVRESLPSDNIIIDNEYVTITVIGYEIDSWEDYNVNLYIVNNSDKDISIVADETSINGFMAEAYFYEDISVGKNMFAKMTWYKSVLEDNDITDVEEIEFKLSAYDKNSWQDKYFYDELIILNP